MANNCKQCFNTHYQPHYHPTTKSLWLCSSVYCGPPHPSRRMMVGDRSRQPINGHCISDRHRTHILGPALTWTVLVLVPGHTNHTPSLALRWRVSKSLLPRVTTWTLLPLVRLHRRLTVPVARDPFNAHCQQSWISTRNIYDIKYNHPNIFQMAEFCTRSNFFFFSATQTTLMPFFRVLMKSTICVK